jgi:hypothetical protein
MGRPGGLTPPFSDWPGSQDSTAPSLPGPAGGCSVCCPSEPWPARPEQPPGGRGIRSPRTRAQPRPTRGGLRCCCHGPLLWNPCRPKSRRNLTSSQTGGRSDQLSPLKRNVCRPRRASGHAARRRRRPDGARRSRIRWGGSGAAQGREAHPMVEARHPGAAHPQAVRAGSLVPAHLVRLEWDARRSGQLHGSAGLTLGCYDRRTCAASRS